MVRKQFYIAPTINMYHVEINLYHKTGPNTTSDFSQDYTYEGLGEQFEFNAKAIYKEIGIKKLEAHLQKHKEIQKEKLEQSSKLLLENYEQDLNDQNKYFYATFYGKAKLKLIRDYQYWMGGTCIETYDIPLEE